MRLPSLAAGLAASALVALAPPSASSAGPVRPAAGEHRAAVIVDTGTQVKSVCVRFTEEFLSGRQVLERAADELQPVFRTFSGTGSAVCALCGKGCPADDSCLTCGGDSYWAYHQAPAGSGYRKSPAGVSSTRVRDGGVEGWRWGTGGPPPLESIDEVCPPGATGTTPPATGGSPSPTAAPGGGGRPSPVASTPAAPASPAATVTTVPGAVETTVLGPTTTTAPTTDDTGRQAASRRTPTGGGDGGGSAASLAVFGLLLAGLVAWTVWVRRTRRAAQS